MKISLNHKRIKDRTKAIMCFIFLFFNSSILLGQNPCNTIIQKVHINDKAFTVYKEKLDEAKNNYTQNPSADNLIWLGRRTAYMGHYKNAIDIYTKGIDQYPKDARFYRHRGHRYISIRCFNLAIKDFKKAARLTRGKPNEVEPDGLPNALNIPTSTLQGNIYYHLGLAYYLQGEYRQALWAYKKCLILAKNPDSYVAAANWLYVINRHIGRDKDAQELLNSITDDMAIIENMTYHEILKLYQGKNEPLEMEKTIRSGSSLTNATFAFGLGNYYSINGNEQKAQEIFGLVVNGNQWSSFGYIAAEARLK